MNRKQSLGAAPAGLTVNQLAAGEAERLPIVDAHLHLWDLTRLRLPWIQRGDVLDRNYTMDDYRQASAGLNVVKAVYMEVDVADEHKRAEADFVLDICRQANTPMVGAVIGGRPASDGFR